MARRRIIEYDILKFFGAIGVVVWHLGPIHFRYVVWAVAAFVFTSWALQRDHTMSFRKIVAVCLNIIFVYGITVGLSALIFGLDPIRPALAGFTLTPRGLYDLIVENAYFGTLWYLVLHVQFMLLFWLVVPWFNRFGRHKALLAAFIFSQACAFGLDAVFGDYLSITFAPWIFIGFVAFYYGEEIVAFARSLSRTSQALLVAAALGLAILTMRHPLFAGYFTAYRDTQFFLCQPYFLFVFLAIFCFADLADSLSKPAVRVMQFCGQYSLIVYMSHIFFRNVFQKFIGPTPFMFLIVFVACIAYGVVIQKAYGILIGRRFKTRAPRAVPHTAPHTEGSCSTDDNEREEEDPYRRQAYGAAAPGALRGLAGEPSQAPARVRDIHPDR